MSNPVPYSVRQVPVIGGLASKLGQVVDIVANPCDASPTIMVQAAFKNIPTLLWSLYKPDPFDFVTARFGDGHHRKKKGKFTIIDSLDGTKVPGVGGVAWAVFRLGEMAERAGWYFLVVDATADFLVNWSSTVYEWSGCEVPGTPYASNTGKDVYAVVHEGWTENIACFWDPKFQPPFFANLAAVSCSAGFDATIASALHYRSEPGTVYGVGQISEIQLVDYWNEKLIWAAQPESTGNGNFGYGNVFKNWDFTLLPRYYAYRINVSVPGWFNFAGSFMQLSGHASRGMLPDP